MKLTTRSPLCSPAFQTTPPTDLPTIGADSARTARVLGRTLIPWQRLLVDGAGTITAAGTWRYKFVIVIVPRRAGKTLAMLSHALTVGRRRPAARSFYAGHRRETAAAMWRDDWFPTLEVSPLHPRHIALRRANGSESITWNHNRSTLRLLPPHGDAIRSHRSDLAMIDEAREFTADQGADIEAAVLPTGATGAGGQLWIVSNAGDQSSSWLARWRDLGRQSITDPDSPIFYLEYAAPADADPDDPDTWAAGHPGIGYHVNIDALTADHSVMSPDDFAAEYLGWWPDALNDDALAAGWLAGDDPLAAPKDPVVLAVEIDHGREWCSIVAADTETVELIEHREHGDWVPRRLLELVETHRPLAVVWDAAGPANALERELRDMASLQIAATTRTVAAAAGAFYDAAILGQIGHRADPIMAAAVAGARRRTVSGSWVFDRRPTGAGPLVAATLARWTARDPTLRNPQIL